MMDFAYWWSCNGKGLSLCGFMIQWKTILIFFYCGRQLVYHTITPWFMATLLIFVMWLTNVKSVTKETNKTSVTIKIIVKRGTIVIITLRRVATLLPSWCTCASVRQLTYFSAALLILLQTLHRKHIKKLLHTLHRTYFIEFTPSIVHLVHTTHSTHLTQYTLNTVHT